MKHSYLLALSLSMLRWSMAMINGFPLIGSPFICLQSWPASDSFHNFKIFAILGKNPSRRYEVPIIYSPPRLHSAYPYSIFERPCSGIQPEEFVPIKCQIWFPESASWTLIFGMLMKFLRPIHKSSHYCCRQVGCMECLFKRSYWRFDHLNRCNKVFFSVDFFLLVTEQRWGK
jgi:hypothetical protein